jgi:hypothetical protein
MSKLVALVGAIILGLFAFTPSCIAQNAPWPPPAGMSAGEYLQRYGRSYNPYTGGDPRQEGAERYRSLPEPPKQYTPPASAAESNPYAGLRPAYDPRTGRYELPCPAAAGSDPYASLSPVYNSYTGKFELPCSNKQ